MTLFAALWAAAPCLAAWPDLADPPKTEGGGDNDVAVVIGIEDYLMAPDIPGARANAEAWYSWLTETRGVRPENAVLLRDEEATDVQIREATERMTSAVGDGGTVWFVFIGHGAPTSDAKDGLLVGVDAQQSAMGLTSRSLRRSEVITAVEDARASSVIVLDACFSGRAPTGDPLAPGLQPLVPEYVKVQARERTAVLTAAQSDQYAGSLPGSRRPAFSYLALGALRGWGDLDGDGRVTVREVADYASNVLASVVVDRRQTPDLVAARPDRVLSRGKEKGPDLGKQTLARMPARQPAVDAMTLVRPRLDKPPASVNLYRYKYRGNVSYSVAKHKFVDERGKRIRNSYVLDLASHDERVGKGALKEVRRGRQWQTGGGVVLGLGFTTAFYSGAFALLGALDEDLGINISGAVPASALIVAGLGGIAMGFGRRIENEASPGIAAGANNTLNDYD